MFHDDATRDLFGLSQAVLKAVEVESGEKNDELDETLARFVKFAEPKGIKELKDDFKSVPAAAKRVRPGR